MKNVYGKITIKSVKARISLDRALLHIELAYPNDKRIIRHRIVKNLLVLDILERVEQLDKALSSFDTAEIQSLCEQIEKITLAYNNHNTQP